MSYSSLGGVTWNFTRFVLAPLTFYRWTSDQLSQYGTKVIPATVRDATYVLDAILDNETELTILQTSPKHPGSSSLLVIQVHGSKIATSEERVANWKIL